MAYAFGVAVGYGACSSYIPTDSTHPNFINVPDAALLFAGEYRRAGPDLVLSDHDGRHHVIPGYFSREHLPALVAPNGASLSGDLVGLLAGSPAPGEYAQAQPTTPPDAIGKVEKSIGNVTAIRNGIAVVLNVGDAVYKSDVVQTGVNSSVGIAFPDGTALSLVADTRMALNEFSYDASSTSNVALLSLVEGTFSFVAGKVAHTGDMKIATPVATMGIRGTTGWVQEQVATINANAGNVSYSFAVVQDQGNSQSGQYDLFATDQTGNPLRDPNGNFILLATVSQTGYVTYVTPQAPGQPPLVTTEPITNSQFAFEQQIIQQVFETVNANNPNPQTNPSNNGSSTPPSENLNNPPIPQLHEQGNQPLTINVPVNGTGPTEPVIVTIIAPPPPPALSMAWGGDTLVEYYLFPTLSSIYYTSPSFTAPAGAITGNPDLGGVFSLSVDASSITASHFTFAGFFVGSPFGGFEVVDLSHDPLISGVTIDPTTNMAGFNSSLISFDSNAVWVNWGGLSFDTSTIVKLDLTFDPPLDPSHFQTIPLLNGSASPVSNVVTLTVADGTALALAGTIDNAGTIAVDASSAVTAIEIDGNVTLQGGGHIELSENNQNYIFGSDATLTNVDNTISGGGDIGNGTLIFHNAGLVEALGSYALIIDTGANPFVNTGTLEADGSTLMVQSPVIGGGSAVIAGGTLEFFDASDNNVSFTGSSPGTLVLDQSQHFTGHISDFNGQDKIDLADIAFSSNTVLDYVTNATDAGGVLTVTDGAHTANLAVLGDYSSSSFEMSSDGHGGTALTDAAITITEQAESSASMPEGGPVNANQDIADGTLTFTGPGLSGSDAATFTPEGSGYVGAFSLDPVSGSNGSASVGWQFSLGNDQINLAPGETLTQTYGVDLAGAQISAVNQAVSVSIGGAGNDHFIFQPGIGADTIINFNAQSDTIDLDGFSNIQSAQQLASLITVDTHGDAVLNLSHTDSISVIGITPDQLHAVLQSVVHLH